MLPKNSVTIGGRHLRDRRARLSVAVAYLVQGFCFAALLTQVGVPAGELRLLRRRALPGPARRPGRRRRRQRPGRPALHPFRQLAGPARGRPRRRPAITAVGLAAQALAAVPRPRLRRPHARRRRRHHEHAGRQRRTPLRPPRPNSFHAVWSVGAILGALATAGTSRLDWSIAASLAAVAVVGASSPSPPARAAAPRRGGRRRRHPAPRRRPVAPGHPRRRGDDAHVHRRLRRRPTGAPSSSTTPSPRAPAWPRSGLAAYQAMMLVGRTAGDRIVRRFGPVGVVSVGGVVGGAGLGLVAASQTRGHGHRRVRRRGHRPVPGRPAVLLRRGPPRPGRHGRRDRPRQPVQLRRLRGRRRASSARWRRARRSALAFVVPAVLAAGIVALAPAFRTTPRRRPPRYRHPPPADPARRQLTLTLTRGLTCPWPVARGPWPWARGRGPVAVGPWPVGRGRGPWPWAVARGPWPWPVARGPWPVARGPWPNARR